MKKSIITILCCAMGLVAIAQTSPNGKIKAEKVNANTLAISYNYNGLWQEIYQANIEGMQGGTTRKIKESYKMLSGKRLVCKNQGKETTYELLGGGQLKVRVMNDGVAFKKVGGKAESDVAVRIDNFTNSWIMNWSDGAEGFYPKNRNMKAGDRLSFPALFEFSGNVFALLTEADIRRDQAASSFYSVDGQKSFNIKADQNEHAAKESSWKIMIIGQLSDVVESTLVTDMSTPNQIGDTSWIKPGVVSWVYWAYNHGSNDYNIIKKYVDMAVNLRLPYVLIDAEWDEMKDGKTIEDAVNYAKENGIKPLIWYNSCMGWINGAPGPKWRLNKLEDREKEFAWCQKIGVEGVKIDFFGGDNNANMAYCIDLMESAAKYHLTVNFHGATIPRGWMRTYPNLLSTEGVYGAEWYNNVPTFTNRAASHNAVLPFTRNVVGSMDYTPCAFSDSQHPHITSHAHELALTALFESGLQHLADRPESFYAQPQAVKDYLGKLPAVWDETMLLSGYPGEYVVMARRSGKTWYISGINGADQPRTITFNTSRLKKLGKHVTTFQDSGDKSNPWKISIGTTIETNQQCVERGGFVIVIE